MEPVAMLREMMLSVQHAITWATEEARVPLGRELSHAMNEVWTFVRDIAPVLRSLSKSQMDAIVAFALVACGWIVVFLIVGMLRPKHHDRQGSRS